MVDIDDLLPRERTPADYLRLVNDPRVDQAGLRTLAASAYPFVRRAVVACPRADATTLAAVPTDGLDRWCRNFVLMTIAKHPQADRSVLLEVLRQTSASLNRPDERPFAAALALARRPELSADEVLDLTRQPHASRRMTRGVRRILVGLG